MGGIFKLDPVSGKQQTVIEFTGLAGKFLGANPGAGLVNDGQGNLWGTTAKGGVISGSYQWGGGTVFKYELNSGKFTTVHCFEPTNGTSPVGQLTPDGAGNLWGVTRGGGASLYLGTIYKINIASGEISLVTNTVVGATAGLTDDGAGAMWGTSYDGGEGRKGTVYRVQKESGIVTTVIAFTDTGSALGKYPQGGLLDGGDGFWWGTTSSGGAFLCGTLFKVNRTTGELVTLLEFSGIDGANRGASPSVTLTLGKDGFIWGTTKSGGLHDSGTVFRVDRNTSELTTAGDFGGIEMLHSGISPSGELYDDGQGFLWGTTYLGGKRNQGTVYRIDCQTGEMSTVASFPSDEQVQRGWDLSAGLVGDPDGWLWGSTYAGGVHGYGTIFKFNPATRELVTVVQFTGAVGPAYGAGPAAELIADGNNNFWGTTQHGGSNGFGTVFRINRFTGVLTNMVSFTGTSGIRPGAHPSAGLTRDTQGNFWGATSDGGANDAGTIFKLTQTGPYWNWTSVTAFDDATSGKSPTAKLVLADGYLWGTTRSGSSSAANGAVFRIPTSGGSGSTFVMNLTGNTGLRPGSYPEAQLVADGAGFLWGTASSGGAQGHGTIFKIKISDRSVYPVLSFTGQGGANPGASPRIGLVPDGKGALWGATYHGGRNNVGTVYKVDITSGILTTVFEFTGQEGAVPGFAPLGERLWRHTDGKFYGITYISGQTINGPVFGGTIYRVTPDEATEAPTLISPVQDSVKKSPVEVAFTLPEAAAPGSVKLTFRKYYAGYPPQVTVDSTLVLSSSYESVGEHRLEFDPRNPVATSGGAILSGASLSDRAYSVTLSYRDTLGNPEASTISNNVVIDTVAPVVVSATMSPAWVRSGLVLLKINATGSALVKAQGTFGEGLAIDSLSGYGGALGRLRVPEDFPEGPITYSASLSDTAGNSSAIFIETTDGTRTIVDRTPPLLTVPGDITAEATGPTGVPVSFQATVADNLDPNPSIVSSVPSGSDFPLGPTVVTIQAKDGAGNQTTGSLRVTVVDTTPPNVSPLAPITLTADATGWASMPDIKTAATASDTVGVARREQDPPVGTPLVLGVYPVSLTIGDAQGNSTTVRTTVKVAYETSAEVESSASPLAGPRTLGSPAPGAGEPDGPPEGSTIGVFFAPALSDRREMAARVTLLDGRKKLDGIYRIDATGAASVPAFQGGAAVDAEGNRLSEVTFKSFLDPILSPSGSLAFAAKLQARGVTTATDEGVWTDAFSDTLVEALREGAQVPGMDEGIRLKAVTSLSIQDGELLALVTLVSGKGGVKDGNDTVLLRQTGVDSAEVLLREGESYGLPNPVSSITVLSPASLSPGHGRWHREGSVIAKVTTKSGSAVFRLAPGETPELILSSLESASGVVPGAAWAKLALPAQGGTDGSLVVEGTLKTLPGVVSAKNDTVLAYRAVGGEWSALAREGTEATEADGALWATFFDPVINAQGQATFLGTLVGPGVKATQKTALWFGVPGDLAIVARLGLAAPDSTGRTDLSRPLFHKFLSFALPDQSGPIFLAEVSGAGATARNKLGLWAVDATGQPRELLRTETAVEVAPGDHRILTGMTLLQSVPASYGVARSYNAEKSIAVLVTFQDKSQVLLRIDLPQSGD